MGTFLWKLQHILSFSFQTDVIAACPELLKLGLLFGEDVDATTTDLPEVLSFQHKLIQEYLAAVYIAENLSKGASGAFLAEAFPTWDVLETHREVVQFACGILAMNDATVLTNYVAKVLHEYMLMQIDMGRALGRSQFRLTTILPQFQKEGAVPLVNPYLTQYPACGRPLAEVMANTKLVYITDVDDNDTLQLNSNPAQIIVALAFSRLPIHSQKFDRLWKALHVVPTNVIALSLDKVHSANRMKLACFSKLQYLEILNYYNWRDIVDKSEVTDLAFSIESWGPQAPLRYCHLSNKGELQYTVESKFTELEPSQLPIIPPLPRSMVKALSRCTNLKYLCLSGYTIRDRMSILMASPPPDLYVLHLAGCNLIESDINHIMQAFKDNKLTHLEELDISDNRVGVDDLHSVVEAISINSHSLKKIGLVGHVGDEFQYWMYDQLDEWKAKLPNIDMI